MEKRHSTGIAKLDACLGGGLLPGTMTVLVGATGIGKTQLALSFAEAGMRDEGRRGVVFDMTCRGDSQSHRQYAEARYGWALETADCRSIDPAEVFDIQRPIGEYLRVFDRSGRTPLRSEHDFDAWHDWQAQLAARLQQTVGFFYQHFIRGVRRVVIDGVEPVERQQDSIQFELLQYIYEQILRKEADWVARDLLRQHFRQHARQVAEHAYDTGDIGCVLACTSRETMLQRLIDEPLEEGDWLAQANTVIYLGRIRDGRRMARGLYVAKHRGSPASDEIVPFRIESEGIAID